jgi:hypothetical protein
MRAVSMRTNGGDRRSRRFPGIIAVFVGGLALVLLLAGTALAQTVTTAAPSTTSAAPSATTQTSAAPQAPAGPTGLIPPDLALAPLNPGWKTAQMVVQVWPEYDKKAVLVIMNFDLPADVPLPATFKFAIPAGATIAGLAEVDSSGNFTYKAYPPVVPGTNWDVATIQVEKYRTLEIDYYYDPGLPAGAGARSFPVLVQLPLDATALNLHIQQPARATDFAVNPALQASGKAQDGFTYAVATFSNVKAGSTLGYLVSYSKPDGNPTKSTSQPASTKLGTRTVLLAAILAVVVIVGGFIVYRLFRKAAKPVPAKGPARQKTQPGKAPSKAAPPTAAKKKKPVAPAESVATDKGESEAKTVTGKEDAGQAVTGHCPACGEDLVKNARFCPNCGEAQGG